MRQAGARLNFILRAVAKAATSGTMTKDLDRLALKLIKEGGDGPAFLNYRPAGAKSAFPASLCVSVNDEVVHGIPGERILNEGDIVGLDLGLKRQNLFVDAAVTVAVGKIDQKAKKLIEITRKALEIGIHEARAGGTIGDIGYAIESFVRPYRYGIVRELAGHGVGYAVHEEPYVPNYGSKGSGPTLKAGMVLAIEPMLNEGGERIKLAKDKFTYKTKDGTRSAHFEHTILITARGAEILTQGLTSEKRGVV